MFYSRRLFLLTLCAAGCAYGLDVPPEDPKMGQPTQKKNKRRKTTASVNAQGGVVVTVQKKGTDGTEVAAVETGQVIVPEKDLFWKALAAHQAGSLKEAQQLYTTALEAGLSSPDLYNNLALVLRSRNKQEEAIEIWEKGVSLYPESSLLDSNRNVIFKPPRLKPEQVEGVNNATSMKDAGVQMFKRALELQNANNLSDALEMYEWAESANNMIRDLHNNMALLYASLGWPLKACETWQKGYMLWPGDDLLMKNKGLIFGGPDGECGKKIVLELEGGVREERFLPPPKYEARNSA